MRPDVFAAVMATGIVSIAAADHGFDLVSDGLIVHAVVALPVLMFLVARAWRSFDMRDPSVALPLFSYVAACAVVGTGECGNVRTGHVRLPTGNGFVALACAP